MAQAPASTSASTSTSSSSTSLSSSWGFGWASGFFQRIGATPSSRKNSQSDLKKDSDAPEATPAEDSAASSTSSAEEESDSSEGKSPAPSAGSPLGLDVEVEVTEVRPPGARTPVPGEFPYSGSMPRAAFDGQIGSYAEPDGTSFNVRGKNYLSDKKKYPSAPTLCKLVATDLLQTSRKLTHASALPGSPPKLTPGRQFVVVNWQAPSSPPLSLVLNYVLPPETPENTAAFAVLRRFMSRDESDDYRNQRFKLIPVVVEGPWIVKRAVGSTPAIIGNKLTTTYHWGPNWFEIDVDVGSSVAANAIWSIIKNYVRSLVIDMAVLIEGKSVEELPERVFGGVRISHVGFGPEITKYVSDEVLDT